MDPACGRIQPGSIERVHELKVQEPASPRRPPRPRIVRASAHPRASRSPANKADRATRSQYMKTSSIGAMCGMVLAAIASFSAFAEQKSAAACRAEWRANKAANQSAGKTEKAFAAECRSGGA